MLKVPMDSLETAVTIFSIEISENFAIWVESTAGSFEGRKM